VDASMNFGALNSFTHIELWVLGAV